MSQFQMPCLPCQQCLLPCGNYCLMTICWPCLEVVTISDNQYIERHFEWVGFVDFLNVSGSTTWKRGQNATCGEWKRGEERKGEDPFGGFHIWCPQNFRIFYLPSPPPVTVTNQQILFLCLFLGTPPSADVIYGSPLSRDVYRFTRRRQRWWWWLRFGKADIWFSPRTTIERQAGNEPREEGREGEYVLGCHGSALVFCLK